MWLLIIRVLMVLLVLGYILTIIQATEDTSKGVKTPGWAYIPFGGLFLPLQRNKNSN